MSALTPQPHILPSEGLEMGTQSLAAVSTANLALGLAGLWTGIRKPEPYDLRVFHGMPRHIGSKQWLTGTALSAPGFMLVLQAAFIAWLLVQPGRVPVRALTILGAMMSLGYPLERTFAGNLRRPNRRTPLAVAGEASALAMVHVGYRTGTEPGREA
jgi:nitroreductase